MNRKEKDRLRKIKREIKRSGNKKVRSQAKRDLMENPEEAHLSQQDYGGRSSKKMNGMDRDATRKKERRQKLYDQPADGIMAQKEPNDEELPSLRDGEQGDGESLPELCSPIRERDAQDTAKAQSGETCHEG